MTVTSDIVETDVVEFAAPLESDVQLLASPESADKNTKIKRQYNLEASTHKSVKTHAVIFL